METDHYDFSNKYDNWFHRRAGRTKRAVALGDGTNPAFVMSAIAQGFNHTEIQQMQRQLRCCDGRSAWLFGIRMNNHFHPYWPLSVELQRSDRNALFNVDTLEWNPHWLGGYST